MSRSYRAGKVTVTVPGGQSLAKRERNWQRKYASAMLATKDLRRLHRAIVKLSEQDLQSIEDQSSASVTDPRAVQVAVRHAAEILGIRTAHDVMFLSYYAPGPSDGPGQAALSRAALAVAALPGGLHESDYELLVTPVTPTLPWLLPLRDEA